MPSKLVTSRFLTNLPTDHPPTMHHYIEGKSDEELYKLETLVDCYNLLARTILPLRSEKIPAEVSNEMPLSLFVFTIPLNFFLQEEYHMFLLLRFSNLIPHSPFPIPSLQTLHTFCRRLSAARFVDCTSCLK